MSGRGSVTNVVLATMAMIASVAFLVSGCSPEVFPAVHDMPAPRPDTTLTPDQVRQATDNLISERDHLSAETRPAGQPSPAADTTGSVTSAALKKKRVPPVRPAAQAAAAPAATTAAQAAGTDAKP